MCGVCAGLAPHMGVCVGGASPDSQVCLRVGVGAGPAPQVGVVVGVWAGPDLQVGMRVGVGACPAPQVGMGAGWGGQAWLLRCVCVWRGGGIGCS